jgi:hypothetical protein
MPGLTIPGERSTPADAACDRPDAKIMVNIFLPPARGSNVFDVDADQRRQQSARSAQLSSAQRGIGLMPG